MYQLGQADAIIGLIDLGTGITRSIKAKESQDDYYRRIREGEQAKRQAEIEFAKKARQQNLWTSMIDFRKSILEGVHIKRLMGLGIGIAVALTLATFATIYILR